MRTTRLKVVKKEYNEIIKDYDIFHATYDWEELKTSKGKAVYDYEGETRQQLNALSVAFKTDGKCLFLFSKNDEAESKIDDYMKEHSYILDFKKISEADFLNEEKREVYFNKDDRTLIQLLANALFNSEKYTFNNVGGKLLYKIITSNWEFSDDKGYLSFIEFKIASEMYLEFPLRTYKKAFYGNYVLDEDSVFRHALPGDEKLQHYTWHSKKGAHNSINFMDMSSREAQETSKIYAVAKFMLMMEQRYSKYFSLEFDEIDHNTFTTRNLPNPHYDQTGKMLTTLFRKRGVYLINLAKDDEKASLIQESLIKQFTNPTKNINVQPEISEEVQDDCFNIVIGHEPEWYKKNELEDPYGELHKKTIVQFVTVEKFFPEMKDSTPFFDKIINEMEMKASIIDKFCYHVFEPVPKIWNFIMVNPLKSKETKDIYDINFFKCTLSKDRKMEFANFNYSDLLKHPEMIDIEKESVIEFTCQLLRMKGEEGEYTGYLHFGETLAGIVYSDINNKHAIIQTPAHTLPNYENITRDVLLTDNKAIVDIAAVRTCIEEFMQTKLSKENYTMVLEQLSQLDDSVEFEKLNTTGIFKNSKGDANKWKRELIDYIRDNTGILVAKELKATVHEEIYELENVTDIQTFPLERNVYAEDKSIKAVIPTFSFIAGRKKRHATNGGMQLNLPVGCLIRSVIWEKKCQYEELLPMHAVEFVRNDSFYTVLPFAFKYLREYAKMIGIKV